MDKRLLGNSEDLLQALIDGNIDLASCEKEELEVVASILSEIEHTGDSATLRMLYEADFWRNPPSIEEFLEDDYFLGSVCRKVVEENQHGLYPCWKEVLYEAFAPHSKVQQLILSGCLAHDTMVMLEDGSMPLLGELIGKRHFKVQTSDGPMPSAGAADSGQKPVVKVVLRNGMELKLTPDHEVECCTSHGRVWKRADNLTSSDMVVVPRSPRYKPRSKLADAEVKLLAYWPTDGSLTMKNSCAVFTDGNIETCEEVLQSLRGMGWNGWLEPEGRGQKCWVVTVEKCATSGFKRWLVRHKAHLKTANVVTPPAIHSAPLHQVALFINRVWAAEGTVYNRTRLVNKKYQTADGFLQLRMKSERFIREMQQLLLRFGILSSVNKIRLRKTKKRLKDYGHHWNLCINSSTDVTNFFKHIGVILGKEESSLQLIASARGRTPKRAIDSLPITGKWLGDYMTSNGLKKYGTKWANLIQGQRNKRLTRLCFDEWCNHHAGVPAAEALRERFRSGDWLVPVKLVEDAGTLPTADIVDSANKKWVANGVSVHNCIGSGKSFCGAVAMLYKMARVLCMRNPLLYFGMSKISKITFTFLSADRAQVKEGAFSYAINGMLASPFFNEQAVVDDRKKYSAMKLDLMRNVTIEAGSKARHALGRNVLGALVDEINFRIEKDAAKEAEKLVKGLERRYKSRFRHSTEGLLAIISSANQETDFLVNHMKRVRNSPSAMVCDFPYWKTAGPVKYEDQGGYLFEREPNNNAAWFAMDIGSSTDVPKILDDQEELELTRASWPSRIMMVPIEHRQEFEDDPTNAIRDVGGRSTGRMAKYFSNIMPVINSLRDYKPLAKMNQIPISVDSDHELKDAFHHNLLLREQSGRWMPMRDPRSPRFIHLDMSTGAVDAMGMAMVHPVHFRKMLKTDTVSQMQQLMSMPVFELDFAVRLVRDKSKEPLDYGKIRAFIVWLRSMGFNIANVSCDLRSLSYETRNILKKMGFNSTYFSLDINKNGYDTFRQVIHEGRFITHEHDLLFLEIVNLEDTGKKIDHPKKFDVEWGDPTLMLQNEFGCFTGDTKVSLLTGEEVPLAELVQRYGGGEPFWVYSLDSSGRVVPGRARNPRVTRHNARLVEVRLDNGEVIRCTPDHLFCVNHGESFEYVPAAGLTPGTSLSALYRRRAPLKTGKREKLLDYEMVLVKGKWEFTHRLVAGKAKPGSVVHHADFNRFNNTPNNLIHMPYREHFVLHSTMANNAYRKKMAEAFAGGVQNKLQDGYKEYISKNVEKHIEYGSGWFKTEAGIAKLAEWGEKRIRRDITCELLIEVAAEVGSRHLHTALECGRGTIYRVVRDAGYKSVAALLRSAGVLTKQKRRDHSVDDVLAAVRLGHTSHAALGVYFGRHSKYTQELLLAAGTTLTKVLATLNHKVVSVTHVGHEDVYDIEVDEFDNFALSSGVFVHNSKDLTDAVAGAIFHGENAKESFSIPYEESTIGAMVRSMESAGMTIGASRDAIDRVVKTEVATF